MSDSEIKKHGTELFLFAHHRNEVREKALKYLNDISK